MITLDELIKNELELELEHEPTGTETHAVSVFLETREITYLVNLDNEISNWVKNNTVRCAWCGHRYLPSEMFSRHQSGEHFCGLECQRDYEEEHGGHFKKVDVGVLYETLRRLDENKKTAQETPKTTGLGTMDKGKRK